MIQVSHSRPLLTAAAVILSIQLLCAHSFAAANTQSAVMTSPLTQLTLEEKAAQVLMVNIAGNKTADKKSIAAFKGTVPGAILLFGYNIADTPQEVRSFLASADQSLAAAAKEAGHTFVPPLYTLDNEGGTVYRTRRLTLPLPAAEEIGNTLSIEETEERYRSLGLQMKDLGLHLNLAPVAEARTEENSTTLGTRTYSEDPKTAAQYAAAAVRGMQSAGICAAVKHFPGNGASDLHKGSAVLDTDYETFSNRYCAGFIPAIKAEAGAILVAHVTVPAVEAVPFCFSAKGITLLRNELGFSGLIITDDIAMQALRHNGATPAENAVRAIAAGCDMVMCSLPAVYPLIAAIAEKARTDTNFAKRLDEAVFRVIAVKQNIGLLGTVK